MILGRLNTENSIGRALRTHDANGNYIQILVEKPQRKKQLGNSKPRNVWIILKCIFDRQSINVWTGFNWVSIQSNGWPL